MGRATDEQLRPFGFIPGKGKSWCAACDTEHKGLDPAAFKCQRCAEYQLKEVDRLCKSFGMEWDE